MAIYKHKKRGNGDTILAEEWNEMGLKIESINAKLDETNSIFTGSLQVTDSLNVKNSVGLGEDIIFGSSGKRFTIHSRADQKDFLQIAADKIDGSWDWANGITLRKGGDVGISTSTPSARLDVNGSALIRGELTVNSDALIKGKLTVKGSGILNKDEFELIQTDASDWLRVNRFRKFPATAMYNAVAINLGGLTVGEWKNDLPSGQLKVISSTFLATNSGSVGIGITDPSHKFHVKTGDAVGLFESTGTHAYLRLHSNEGFDKRIELANRPGGRAAIWVSGGGDAINALANGNVGIGATNPSEKLEISGKLKMTGQPAPRWNNSLSSYVVESQFHYGTSSDQQMYLGEAGNYVEIRGRARFDQGLEVNASNVTVDNNYGIYWHGQGDRSYSIYRESGAWNHPYPDLRIAFHTGIQIGGHYNYGGTRFYNNSDMKTELMSIGNGGQDVRVANKLFIHGTLQVSPVPFSDRRLKTKIRQVKNSLDKLTMLNGKVFHWKKNLLNKGFEPGEQVGLVAQEVEKIFPQVVFADQTGTKCINYNGLVAILIEAVKELDKKLK